MFFTLHDGMVLFSSADDGKVADIRENPVVSLLLNGYEGQAAEMALLAQKQGVAVTLYGSAAIVQEPSTKAEYHALLQAAHPDYADAFQGDDKVVFTMTPN